jgi:pimeloyl-ACP methyl ester carboxylesterase
MITQRNSIRPYAQRIRPALSLLLIVLSVGCASKSSWDGKYLADRNERLPRGCVFYFDGAGGGTRKSNYAKGVVEGMLEAGYRGAGELVAWETGKGLMKDQDASVAYKRAKADAGAASIQSYRKKYPGAPVGLLGFSAGTAEAIFALEVLPEMEKVDHVVLLGTSISRDYDMTEALKRVKNKLYIFTSTHDQMLGTLMPLSGTADRKFNDPGAGIKGFVLPAGASAATRKLYAAKIVTIPYSDDFRKDKDKGHHFDNVKKEFIRDHVAPLLIGRPAHSTSDSPS